MHGEADETLSVDATNEAVAKTAALAPASSLEYIALPDVTHAPALQASQSIWMDWISDRFAGKEARSGFQRTTIVRPRPAPSYQVAQSWYLEPASQFFHAPKSFVLKEQSDIDEMVQGAFSSDLTYPVTLYTAKRKGLLSFRQRHSSSNSG
ncbi:hypothetical protein XANCAGTX0491_005582 [Xanthoria calcicola]